MTDIWQLREGERLDDLVRDGMKIIQRTDQFCFSMDSVLLAHYVNIRAKDRIVDLGTGTGVIALLTGRTVSVMVHDFFPSCPCIERKLCPERKR